MIAEGIRTLVEGRSLTREQMRDIFGEMMDGKASDPQKTALLVALRMKGESIDEVTGAASAMRERVTALQVDAERVIDTCGTGGDGRGTFNISTVSAIVAASAGALVAKHGNRAVSSACGSADVLRSLGVNIDLAPEQVAEVLNRIGISFLFAPKFHPAMGAVAGVRRELGVRTIFNVLGPLTNPAFAKRQVLGVYSSHLVETIASVLRELGAVHALVVHSEDGMDEISISAPTFVAELRDGEVKTQRVTPEELGVDAHGIEAIAGGDSPANAAIALSVLNGEKGAAREVVIANAGAAIYVAGLAESIAEGVRIARDAIDTGAARQKLEELVALTTELGRGAA